MHFGNLYNVSAKPTLTISQQDSCCLLQRMSIITELGCVLCFLAFLFTHRVLYAMAHKFHRVRMNVFKSNMEVNCGY